MRTVTNDEIEASVDRIHGMSESDTREFATQMTKEQPILQVYIAAICERGDFTDENDMDAFANLASIVWHAMRTAAGGRLTKVKEREIDKRESKMMQLFEYAEEESDADFPRMVAAWTEDYNQRPLLEFVVETLMSPKNPYGVTPGGSGPIFTYLKVIIDCLDNAKIKKKF